jgi:hypothetical protein
MRLPASDAAGLVRKQAMINAAFNAVINGFLVWWKMEPGAAVPLTLDSISSGRGAVLGTAIASAFTMGLMVTMMSFLMFRKKTAALGEHGAGLRTLSFWPDYPALAVKNALFVFGALVAAAILWQKFVGTVEVGPFTAAAVVALVAAVSTGYATTSTMHTMLRDAALAESGERR